MKKKKLLYILIILITLFTFNMNVNAEEVHYFEKKHFKEDDEFYNFAQSLCFNGNGISCKHVCSNGFEGSYGNGFTPLCDTESIEKIRIGDGGAEETILWLRSTNCGNDKSCYEYISNDYCEGYATLNENDSKYILCDNMNKIEEITGRCEYNFRFDNNNKVLTFSGELTIDKKDLVLTISDFTNYGGTFSEDEGVMRLTTPSTELYFYPKYQDFNNFKNEYIKRYNEEGSCPTLCFGYDRKTSATYSDIWYTSLDQTEFDSKKYRSGYRQCSSGGQTTLEGERQTIPKEKITFENCEELFAESPDLLNMIKFVVNIVKIGIPILLIVLGILDFSKAIFVGKEDEMKKTQEKFMKRIIIGVCIFLVPTILKFILTIGNTVWGDVISTDFCGIL